ncbi:MAG: hypothetical protein GAK35_04218 [Herbaspirillum frisingense]|uniref:Uncharacterized protein n=1 Tax=Herbaspirillum frisingense TaxID=92645 RepID=A0A7V8FSR9_9BURK|nr:MAG: hypothetical protein GAK35_04218 [Herbaspirillum frisingense]
MKTIIALGIAAAWMAAPAHADICSDLHTIYAQSATQFASWKSGEGDAESTFPSSFVAVGASTCTIGEDPASFSCIWKFGTPAAMDQAYRRMLGELESCRPLMKMSPEIKPTEPQELRAGASLRKIELVGFDYLDADVMMMLGKEETSGMPDEFDLNGNKLTFTFVAPDH